MFLLYIPLYLMSKIFYVSVMAGEEPQGVQLAGSSLSQKKIPLMEPTGKTVSFSIKKHSPRDKEIQKDQRKVSFQRSKSTPDFLIDKAKSGDQAALEIWYKKVSVKKEGWNNLLETLCDLAKNGNAKALSLLITTYNEGKINLLENQADILTSFELIVKGGKLNVLLDYFHYFIKIDDHLNPDNEERIIKFLKKLMGNDFSLQEKFMFILKNTANKSDDRIQNNEVFRSKVIELFSKACLND